MENKYELYHYGIKGQKWGVRRFQNPDGSLTAKGRKRLAKDQKSWEREVKKNFTNPYNKAADKINSRLDDFNAKYDKYDFSDPRYSKMHKKYVKEYCDMWNDLYTKELDAAFGDSPVKAAKKWVSNLDGFEDRSYKDLVWGFMNPEDMY